MKVLNVKYEHEEVSWKRDKICGINLKWDCTKYEGQLNALGRMNKLQQRCGHPTPSKLQHAPADFTAPTYGQ